MYPSRRPKYRLQQPAPSPRSSLFGKMKRKELLATLATLVVAVLLFIFFSQHHRNKTAPTPAGGNTTQSTQASFNKKQYSTTDPNSIWVIVNKPLPLNPLNYAPSDLVVPSVPLRVPGNESMQIRKEAASALEKLFAGAKEAGLNLMLASGYRSYAYQVNLYNGYVQSIGQAAADKTSARPGHSEHQTGLAADIEPTSKKCELDACFGQTPEGAWLAANAWKYGFIIRYTEDKVSVTGYDYEPWHVRYVGVDLANELHKNGMKTLEEFFGAKGGKEFN